MIMPTGCGSASTLRQRAPSTQRKRKLLMLRIFSPGMSPRSQPVWQQMHAEVDALGHSGIERGKQRRRERRLQLFVRARSLEPRQQIGLLPCLPARHSAARRARPPRRAISPRRMVDAHLRRTLLRNGGPACYPTLSGRALKVLNWEGKKSLSPPPRPPPRTFCLVSQPVFETVRSVWQSGAHNLAVTQYHGSTAYSLPPAIHHESAAVLV